MPLHPKPRWRGILSDNFRSEPNPDQRPHRRQHLFTLYSLAHAIGCHVKAWCAAQFGDTTHWSLEQTLDAMAALLE